MSERGTEDVPQEVSVELRDDEFQRQVLEYIRDTRNELQLVNEKISMLGDEVKTVKNSTQVMIQESMKVKKDNEEEEILSQGFSSYSFTPFEKDKKGGGGKMSSFDNDEDDNQASNKKLDNDEDDSDDSDDDDEKDDKNMGKKDGRKSFMREANEAGTLTKGFQQAIAQPPSLSLTSQKSWKSYTSQRRRRTLSIC